MKTTSFVYAILMAVLWYPCASRASDCKPDEWAFIGNGDIGSTTWSRGTIPIRPVTNSAAWTMGCQVTLAQSVKHVGKSACEPQNVLDGAKLSISNRGVVTLLNGSGFPMVNAVAATMDPKGRWLHVRGETNSTDSTTKPDDFYIYLIDYFGSGIPEIKPIPKFYMVEVFDGDEREGTPGDCRSEQPNDDNVHPYVRIPTKPKTDSTGSVHASSVKGQGSNSPTSQSDVGVGPEPRK